MCSSTSMTVQGGTRMKDVLRRTAGDICFLVLLAAVTAAMVLILVSGTLSRRTKELLKIYKV